MTKILVRQDKFDEACRLYGFERAREFLIVAGHCRHDWKIETSSGTNMFTLYVYAFSWEECRDCGEKRNELNLL